MRPLGAMDRCSERIVCPSPEVRLMSDQQASCQRKRAQAPVPTAVPAPARGEAVFQLRTECRGRPV